MVAATILAAALATPIRLHPANPRYFEFNGRPLALITSTEHFGAIVNLDFRYEKYLDALQAAGFTLTQAWTGAYVEPDSDAGVYNPLDPKPAAYITPWARSAEPGNKKGGNKWNLTEYNETFFERLVDFVDAAASRGIVVEVGLFGGYEQSHETIWEYCPFHPSNNVNVAAGTVNRTTVFSLDAPAELRAIQIDTARRIATALREKDNVYFQLVNGPNYSSPEWGAPIRDVLLEVTSDEADGGGAAGSESDGGGAPTPRMLSTSKLSAAASAAPPHMIAVPAAWVSRGFTRGVSIANYVTIARPSNASEAPLATR